MPIIEFHLRFFTKEICSKNKNKYSSCFPMTGQKYQTLSDLIRIHLIND